MKNIQVAQSTLLIQGLILGKLFSKKVKILNNDTIDTLSKRILKQEHYLYPKALSKVIATL